MLRMCVCGVDVEGAGIAQVDVSMLLRLQSRPGGGASRYLCINKNRPCQLTVFVVSFPSHHFHLPSSCSILHP
jgi:hypothetical protein